MQEDWKIGLLNNIFMKDKISVKYKDIPWYEWKYQISTLWEMIRLPDVWNVKLKTLKPYCYWKWWNYYVWLCDNGNRKRVRICDEVAKAFIKNPNEYIYVWHKDWDKTNNKPDNLFWSNKDNHRKNKRSHDTIRLFSFAEFYAKQENREEKLIEDWYNEFIIKWNQ